MEDDQLSIFDHIAVHNLDYIQLVIERATFLSPEMKVAHIFIKRSKMYLEEALALSYSYEETIPEPLSHMVCIERSAVYYLQSKYKEGIENLNFVSQDRLIELYRRVWLAKLLLWYKGIDECRQLATSLIAELDTDSNTPFEIFLFCHSLITAGRCLVLLDRPSEGLALYFRAVDLLDRMQNKFLFAEVYYHIGNTYLTMGDMNTATEYLHKGLKMAKEIQARNLISSITIALMKALVRNNNADTARNLLYSVKDDMIDGYQKYGEAIILMQSTRLATQFQALPILRSLLESNLPPYIHVVIKFHITELLLIEFKYVQDLDVPLEILKQISEISYICDSLGLQVYSYYSRLLYSKILILQGRLTEAHDQLLSLKDEAKKNGNVEFMSIVGDELDTLNNNITRWSQLLNQSEISSVMEQTQLNAYLKIVQNIING